MISYLSALLWRIRDIKVYALIGSSGTGKSFRARLIAQKYGIEMIIDDGLLIRGDELLAGRSAKKEPIYLSAVRTALFDDKSHRDETIRMLGRSRFRKILILGTSEKMVQKICERLQIPKPMKIIKIEEVATKEEIEKALQSRKIEGKHVIPIPSLEIKRSYPTIFYDSIRVFLKRSFYVAPARQRVYEKSVVKPEYSKRGRVSISEAALSQMVDQCIREFDDSLRIRRLAIRADTQGYRLTIVLEVPYGTKLISSIRRLQENIIDNIESFTGILIEEVNILIDRFAPRR